MLKIIVCFLSLASHGRTVKLFFTLFKLNITFYFKCYLHHNCSLNLNSNNTQLYSSEKQLRDVPSSVFWFLNFCFLPFLRRTSVLEMEGKLVLLCTQVNRQERNDGHDIKVSVSKLVHRSRNTNQSCVQRSKNPRNIEKVCYFVIRFLQSQQYSYITNINNWAGAQRDIDMHVSIYE